MATVAAPAAVEAIRLIATTLFRGERSGRDDSRAIGTSGNPADCDDPRDNNNWNLYAFPAHEDGYFANRHWDFRKKVRSRVGPAP